MSFLRFNHGTVALVISSLIIQHMAIPCGAHEGVDSSQNAGSWRMSQTETVIAATFFGSGVGLIVASGFVEGKYEKVTGYREVGGTFDPIITRGGTDTDGLLLAGAVLIFLGACFVVSPSVGSSKDSASNSSPSEEQAGFTLAMPALEGQATAIGVAHGF